MVDLYKRPYTLAHHQPKRLTGILTVFCVDFISSIMFYSLKWYHPEKAGCAMSYMYQSYAKLKSFDSNHTRLANRYSLFLYRDAKYDGTPDENFKPDGVPVFFIPGNAGSYRQVRSIASLAAEITASSRKPFQDLTFTQLISRKILQHFMEEHYLIKLNTSTMQFSIF